MSEHFDGHSPLRGWTTKQIADYVASVTGDETPISLVWNWQKRTESLEKGDPRRFPDPIGDDERGQKVFNPLKVIEWLETNKKVAGNVDVHPLLLDLVSAARGVGITKRWLEEVLASFLDADRVATPARGAKGPDLVVRGKSGDLAIDVKHFERGVKKLDRISRRQLLEEVQRYFLADKLNSSFHTPTRLATLAAQLLDVQPGSTVYDPCAGTGRLLAAVAEESKKPGTIRLVGRELNELSARLGNAMISVSETAGDSGIRCGDSLHFDETQVGFADAVVAHIPLRTKIGREEIVGRGTDQRFVYTKPTTSGETAWIQVLLAALKPSGGRAAVITSVFATSHRQTDKLREALLRRRHVEAVISLAQDRRSYGTGLPPTLILFDTDPERGFRREHVLFAEVDVITDDAQFASAGAFLVNLVKSLRRGAADARASHSGVAWRAAHTAEIESNNFVLGPGRYVHQTVQVDEAKDLEEKIKAVSKGLAVTRRELQKLHASRKDLK